MQNQERNWQKTEPASLSGEASLQSDSYVVLKSDRMHELRMAQGMSIRQFADLTDVSPNTAARFFRDQRIQWRIARQLFDKLGIRDMRPYIRSGESEHQAGQGVFEQDAAVLLEWRLQSPLGQPLELSNGLVCQVCKLVHREMPDTYARGKCYDLAELRTRDQQRVQEQLLRHPQICRKLLGCPRIPVNERVVYSQDRSRFWVIDAWFDGITLEDKLRYGPLSRSLLPRVMKQVLQGVEAMHANDIIRRELSPRYVALTEPAADVLLTELELAKLLEGTISVSESWDEDPYRAPEVEASEVDVSVDFYSWAQILLHAATGRRPPSPANSDLLEATKLPPKVRAVAQRCLSLSHRWRPHSVGEILRQLEGWD